MEDNKKTTEKTVHCGDYDFSKLRSEVPHKWRVQSFSKYKKIATCVAYIDARQVQDLLDEIVGPANWQCDYKVIGNSFLAGIGIRINDQWVWKWDTGDETQVEANKGRASDALKRAAVHWGIGRFLYEKEIAYVNASDVKDKGKFPHVVDENGGRVYDVTTYINNGGRYKKPQPNQDKRNIGEVAKKAWSNDSSEKVCPKPDCGKKHTGKYAKCYDCWKSEQSN